MITLLKAEEQHQHSSNSKGDTMLKELQKLRSEHLNDIRMYWAITIVIDLVLGLDKEDIEDDMERLRRAL